MTLNKHSDGPSDQPAKSSSRTLIIVLTVIILLALGYTIVRTLAVPRSHSEATTQPTK